MSVKKIAVVGTGTDIGKTVLSLLIVQILFQQGHTPFYIKPFQTGCKNSESSDTDAAFVYKNTQQLKNMNPARSVLNCHENPKAPCFAAKDMGQVINIEQTIKRIKEKEHAEMNGQPVSHLVIEAAGGLLVPITENNLVLDFISQTDSVPIVAADVGLGTINHTLLTLRCLDQQGLKPAGVVLIESSKLKTDFDLVEENIQAIKSFSNIKVVGVIPFIKDFISPPEIACEITASILAQV